MKQFRGSLDRAIDLAFARKRYIFFLGIKGLGKHYAIYAYAKKRNLKCTKLDDRLPTDSEVLYIVDDLSNRSFLESLCQFLSEQDHYLVCFISEQFLPDYFYGLLLSRIQIFSAKEFLFSLQDCQQYLKSEHLTDEDVSEIYEKSEGCVFALRYHLMKKRDMI